MAFLFAGMFEQVLRQHLDALEQQFKPLGNEVIPATVAPRADRLLSLDAWARPAVLLLAGVVAVLSKQIWESPTVCGSLYVLVLVPSVFLFCGKRHLALRRRLAALKEQAQPSQPSARPGKGTTLVTGEMSADVIFSRDFWGLWTVSLFAGMITWTFKGVWETPFWFEIYALVLLPTVFFFLGRQDRATRKRLEALEEGVCFMPQSPMDRALTKPIA